MKIKVLITGVTGLLQICTAVILLFLGRIIDSDVYGRNYSVGN